MATASLNLPTSAASGRASGVRRPADDGSAVGSGRDGTPPRTPGPAGLGPPAPRVVRDGHAGFGGRGPRRRRVVEVGLDWWFAGVLGRRVRRARLRGGAHGDGVGRGDRRRRAPPLWSESHVRQLLQRCRRLAVGHGQLVARRARGGGRPRRPALPLVPLRPRSHVAAPGPRDPPRRCRSRTARSSKRTPGPTCSPPARSQRPDDRAVGEAGRTRTPGLRRVPGSPRRHRGRGSSRTERRRSGAPRSAP